MGCLIGKRWRCWQFGFQPWSVGHGFRSYSSLFLACFFFKYSCLVLFIFTGGLQKTVSLFATIPRVEMYLYCIQVRWIGIRSSFHWRLAPFSDPREPNFLRLVSGVSRTQSTCCWRNVRGSRSLVQSISSQNSFDPATGYSLAPPKKDPKAASTGNPVSNAWERSFDVSFKWTQVIPPWSSKDPQKNRVLVDFASKTKLWLQRPALSGWKKGRICRVGMRHRAFARDWAMDPQSRCWTCCLAAAMRNRASTCDLRI